MGMFDNLTESIEEAKKRAKLPEDDLEQLKALNIEVTQTEIKSMFPKDDVAEKYCKDSWEDRLRLDALQLHQRAIACESVKHKVVNSVKILTEGLN